MIRSAAILGLVAGAMLLTVACNETSPESNDGSGGGPGSSSGSSGGAPGSSSGSSGSGEVPSGVRICPPPSAPTTCSEEELAPYQACVATECDETYKTCFGPAWREGSFSGACGAFVECLNECECADIDCRQKCVPDTDCTDCLKNATCMDACQLPPCAATGPANEGSCAELEACCESLAGGDDPFYEEQCQNALNIADGDIIKCASMLHTFRTNDVCP